MNTVPPTVFVVDDDLSHLTSVARLLRASGFQTHSYTSAEEFLRDRPPHAPGCVIADLQMPGMTGIDLQEALAKSENPMPVVFLTGRGDIPTSVWAMRHGAEDFLTKHDGKDVLLAAVQRALARDALEREGRARRRELQQRVQSLTPREHGVLLQVLRGRLNKQIAADLGIDERTVKRHRTSLMGKLKVRSVAELTRLAVEAGLPDVASEGA